ncbi:MAG: helix-turn-helix domain-containing protein [Bacteroidales bacterium]|nr:helix-turn-helix domain-containing protein [Bacteroidales bacterium]
MAKEISNDPIFQLAEEYVNRTSEHIFLTGRAGTGKTTFLRHIVETSPKQILVAAPTGVAAINAGGVTLHSLFQLPLEPYIPGNRIKENHRFNQKKIKVIRAAELLIIDEVSMLRSDVLDAIDTTLRFVRKNHRPFGGIQMLYIGDMFQLPPVVKDDEWGLLKNYYKSPFFFHAKAIEKVPLVYLELKKIYRQQQQNFIELLNRVRNNAVTINDLNLLNEKYISYNAENQADKPIVLCTHNAQADRINNAELQKLTTPLHVFTGEIEGDFPDYALPTEMNLQLKVDAKIMFIRNDIQEQKRFYNGKIAKITRIDEDGIFAVADDSPTEIKIEKEIWENMRYDIDKEKNEIVEEIVGSFRQYPVRLAWAITIHKSQGLTFERVIIDIARAFAAGQAYVALSRCTSLEGIVLQSPVEAECIQTSNYAMAFSLNERPYEALLPELEAAKQRFRSQQLINHFNFKPLVNILQEYQRLTEERISDELQAAHDLAMHLFREAYLLEKTATSFQNQLQKKLQYTVNEQLMNWLKERCSKAVEYFYNEIKSKILNPLQAHITTFSSKKAKAYRKHLLETNDDIIAFCVQLAKVKYDNLSLLKENVILPQLTIDQDFTKKTEKAEKLPKGETKRISLEMFLAGNTPAQIAQLRNLKTSTIETHLLEFIKTGQIAVTDLVTPTKIDKILPLVQNAIENETYSSGTIKETLGEEYNYTEIKAVHDYYTYILKKEK